MSEVVELARTHLCNPYVGAPAAVRQKRHELSVAGHGGRFILSIETRDRLVRRACDRVAPEVIAAFEPDERDDGDWQQRPCGRDQRPSKARTRRRGRGLCGGGVARGFSPAQRVLLAATLHPG